MQTTIDEIKTACLILGIDFDERIPKVSEHVSEIHSLYARMIASDCSEIATVLANNEWFNRDGSTSNTLQHIISLLYQASQKTIMKDAINDTFYKLALFENAQNTVKFSDNLANRLILFGIGLNCINNHTLFFRKFYVALREDASKYLADNYGEVEYIDLQRIVKNAYNESLPNV